MKNIFILCLGLFTVNSAFGQDANTVNPMDTTFLVNGVCEMCQNTIETSLQIDGVESAFWNVETKELKVSFDASAVSFDEIQKAVLDSGYDTEFQTAAEEDYEKVHECCKYREPHIVEQHK